MPIEPVSPPASDLQQSLYRELRRIAGARMRMERGNHTLQPTALVHEAYLRLAEENPSAWGDRPRILALAAHAMRNILVDHARARRAEKRGAGAIQVTLDEGHAVGRDELADVLAVDEALARLEEFDPRQARVMEMHFFGGLTFEEIAVEIGVSSRTIKRDWTMARAWLHGQLATAKAQG
jgi:RNA polymerase sigma factor (TIGR02999 family)